MNFNKIFILLFLPYILYANVSLSAPDSFFKGDQIIFKITASGGDVRFPKISNVDGNIVQNAGTSSQTTVINGTRSQKLIKTFVVRANKDFTIPSFKIEVGGKIEKTKPKTLKMKLVKKTISSDYDIEIKVDKKNIYVGENIIFTLKFKYNKNAQIVDLSFHKPTFDNFWAKELKANKQTSQGEFIVQELKYLLFPQKSGIINIDPVRIDAVTLDSSKQNYGFFSSNATKSTPIYSNRLVLDIKPLPKDIKLIGDFEISSTIDKTSVNSGDAVSYKVTIKGRGNVDDIDEIKLNIPNTTIYDNPSKKEFNIKDGLYGGVFSKTYSIVSQNSFEIPSISLNYFDKKTNSVKTIKTKNYKIDVKGAVKKTTVLEVAKEENSPTFTKEKLVTKIITTSDNQKIIFFILGMIVASIVISLYLILKNKTTKKEDTPLEKLIKNCKSTDELLKVLVVYINIDKQLDKIIYNLETTSSSIELKKTKKDILSILKDKTLKVKF